MCNPLEFEKKMERQLVSTQHPREKKKETVIGQVLVIAGCDETGKKKSGDVGKVAGRGPGSQQGLGNGDHKQKPPGYKEGTHPLGVEGTHTP